MEKKSRIHSISFKTLWTHPIHLLAFGFGSGLLPKMPGTYGTIVAIPLYLLLSQLSLLYYGLITFLLILISIYCCEVTSRDLGVHDYPGIVFDEIVGFLVTMFAVPFGWWSLLGGFLLFRLFDIWKPWPITWLDQHVKGGLGIVVDDLLAGLYACLVLHLLLQLPI
jgi:phosphatidylglycerophosphatase A